MTRWNRKVEHQYYPIDMMQGIAKIEDFRMLNYNGKLYSDLSFRSVRYHSLSTIKTVLDIVGLKNITMYSDFNNKELGLNRERAVAITVAAAK